MKLIEIRATAEGRTQLMAVISSEANLRQLDGFKEISARLAKATGLTNAQARELAAEGRAVVWIDFGLYSTEVGHAQTAPYYHNMVGILTESGHADPLPPGKFSGDVRRRSAHTRTDDLLSQPVSRRRVASQ